MSSLTLTTIGHSEADPSDQRLIIPDQQDHGADLVINGRWQGLIMELQLNTLDLLTRDPTQQRLITISKNYEKCFFFLALPYKIIIIVAMQNLSSCAKSRS